MLNGWILPIGEASAVEGLLSTGPTLSSCSTARCLAFLGPPQQKLSSGSESIHGRLLTDLVHHEAGRLGRHLVAAIWYQCSHV